MSELRKPEDWAPQFDNYVTTPTGWTEDGKSWDEPISREEYETRLNRSVFLPWVHPLPKAAVCSDCKRESFSEHELDRVCGVEVADKKYCEGMLRIGS